VSFRHRLSAACGKIQCKRQGIGRGARPCAPTPGDCRVQRPCSGDPEAEEHSDVMPAAGSPQPAARYSARGRGSVGAQGLAPLRPEAAGYRDPAAETRKRRSIATSFRRRLSAACGKIQCKRQAIGRGARPCAPTPGGCRVQRPCSGDPEAEELTDVIPAAGSPQPAARYSARGRGSVGAQGLAPLHPEAAGCRDPAAETRKRRSIATSFRRRLSAACGVIQCKRQGIGRGARPCAPTPGGCRVQRPCSGDPAAAGSPQPAAKYSAGGREFGRGARPCAPTPGSCRVQRPCSGDPAAETRKRRSIATSPRRRLSAACGKIQCRRQGIR